MATIVENILGDRALQIAQEEFARKLSFGNKWNALRIGVLWRINDSVTIPTRCRFQIGMCNGDTNTFASSTCSGYLGAVSGFLTSTIAYTYDAPNTAYTTGAYWYGYCTKVGASVTDALYAGFTGNQYFAASTSTGPRFNGITIYRNSATSYTVSYHYVTLAQFNFKTPDLFDFQSFMEDESLSGWAGNMIGVSTNPAYTGLSTSLSSLDTASIYWNKTNPLEISALAVSRFY
jgi:hypothetical protein